MRKPPIAHSCGHDMHVTWLMGATRILAENRDKWRGTVMAVFQPAEETGEGASAMVEDGMVKRFPKPDIALAPTRDVPARRPDRHPQRTCAVHVGQLGSEAVWTWRARLVVRSRPSIRW